MGAERDSVDEALERAIEERNRLWAELQQKNAVEADLEYWQSRAADLESSLWWRAGFPLRYLKRFLDDPAGMLEGRAHAVRRRRRGA
jgi:hypothetical protein